MAPCENGGMDRGDAYCFAQKNQYYAIYLPEGRTGILKLPSQHHYDLYWFDPLQGGGLHRGSIEQVEGADWIELGHPPINDGRDWVLLIRNIQFNH